jgi:hypothetical protein
MKRNLYSSKFIEGLQITVQTLCLIFLASTGVSAQTTLIKGRVTDAQTNKPLSGVSITVKGKTTGSSTDSGGNYSLAADPKAILTFSYVGYQSVEIKLDGKTIFNMVLQPGAGLLNNVVVTALGITREKRALGYSVSEIKGSTLTEARENSFVNDLEGRVAGVNVSGVATGPNGATNVVIRGLTSMTGSSQPLYVLNGIPLVSNNYATTGVVGGYGG